MVRGLRANVINGHILYGMVNNGVYYYTCNACHQQRLTIGEFEKVQRCD